MFTTGFQSIAFQCVLNPIIQGGGGRTHKERYTPPAQKKESHANSFELSKHQWEMEEYEKRKKLMAAAEEARLAEAANKYKIEALEFERLKDLANASLQQQLRDLLLESLYLEAQRIRAEEMLTFYMREEDDILAILYSMPFLA